MELSFENIMGFIKANFFYDLRSTVLTICLVFVLFYLFKLLKYDNEKPVKSLKYLTIGFVCGAVFMLIY